MTPAKTHKFLRLLATTDIPTVTLMPLLVDTLKALIPSYEVSIIHVNEHTEPTTYYTEKFDAISHEMFSKVGHELANNQLHYDDTNAYDPAAYSVLFKAKTPYGNLVPVSDAYLNGATYRYFFAPNGIYHVLDILIKDQDKPIAVIGLFRQQHEAAFTQKDVNTIGKLYATLCQLFIREQTIETNAERRFLEKSTMVTVDENGVIINKAPEAMRLLSSALACKARELLSHDKILPSSCLAFRQQVQKVLQPEPHNAQQKVYLAAPFGRLLLRAYPLEQVSDAQQYGIHIDFYGDIAEAVLAYLRTTSLPYKLLEIAFFISMGDSSEKLQARLNLSYNSLKTYLNRLYVFFDISDFNRLKNTLIQRARKHATAQNERRHLLVQFLQD